MASCGVSSINGGVLGVASGQFNSVSGGLNRTANGGYDLFDNWDGAGPTWAAVGFNGH